MRVPHHSTAVDPRTLFATAASAGKAETVHHLPETQNLCAHALASLIPGSCERLFEIHRDIPLDHGIAPIRVSAPVETTADLPYVPIDASLAPPLNPITERRVSRKMTLIRRSGLFGDDTKGARISRAATLEDLRAAYKLVHRIYLGSGYISEEQAEMRLRIFETSACTATFIAKKDGRVVGVLSIVPDTAEFGLPSDEAFKDVLAPLRASGRKIGEITNQAVDEAYRNTAVPTELMRCALAHGIEGGFDIGVAAVSPSHNAFYELLGFRQIGTKRSYSGKIHDPVVPLQIDLEQHRHERHLDDPVDRFMHAYLTAENPYFLYVGAWEKIARERFEDPDLLRELFVGERDFLGECSAEQIAALREHWGGDLFHAVTGSRFAPLLPKLQPDLEELTAPHAGEFSVHRIQPEDPVAREVEFAVACGRCVDDLGLPPAVLPRGPIEPVTPPAAAKDAGIFGLLRHLAVRAREPMVQCPQFRQLVVALWRNSMRRPASGNC